MRRDTKNKRKTVSLLLILIVAFMGTSCSSSSDYEIFSAIKGTVTDYETGAPLANVSLLIAPGNITVSSNSDGEFLFENLEDGQYMITAQKSGYQPNRKTATAISGETATVNIPMTKIPN